MEKCRLCLKEEVKLNDVSNLHENLPVSVIIMIVVPVKIEEVDNLPKTICDICLEVILSAWKLRDTSLRSDIYLRDNFEATVKLESDVYAESIDEQELSTFQDYEIDKTNSSESLICDLCGECFGNKNLIESHMITIHSNKTNQFKVCLNKQGNGKSLVWNYFGELYDQLGMHIDQSHFYCQICVDEKNNLDTKYSTTSSTSSMAQHLQKVHKIGNLKEKKRNRQPPNKISTEIVQQNDLERKVNCYKASSTGSFAWYFFGKLVDSNGQPIEEEIKYFFCKLCVQDKNFKTKYVTNCSTSNLILHLKNVHGVENGSVDNSLLEPLLKDPSKFEESIEKTCSLCKENFSTRKAYFNHLRTLHKEMQPTDFICHVCSKTFTKSYMLTKHMRVHDKPKFLCSQCPASFAFPENLKRHENIHDPNHYNRFQCDRCSKSYSEFKALQHHIRNVHLNVVRERKFSCLQCDMKFYGANHLRQHSFKHTGEKPHECQYCSVAYTSKGDLMKHLQKNHLGDSIYSCTIDNCTASFRLQVELREHYKVHYLKQDQDKVEELKRKT